MPGAAVHRHILDRMNAINDSLKKKKDYCESVNHTRDNISHRDIPNALPESRH